MTFSVIITPEAQANLTAAYDYIAKRSPMNAVKWLWELYAQIERLETFPHGYGAAREQEFTSEEIRQVVFKIISNHLHNRRAGKGCLRGLCSTCQKAGSSPQET